ncbi:MAG: hypothetical protein M3N54_13060 [Acidobacteriota bacterium]|nr:hypothetical protein [Acidobacteriota bacterium]
MATLTFAQNNGDEAEIITVKTLTGDSFERLMNLLGVFGNVRYKGDSQLRTIVAYGSKENVAQMRRVVEQLDRPGSEAAIGRNIDMTLTLLRCSTKAGANAANLPTDMESVARQLRAATQYKDIQLLDIVPLRLQEGKDSSENLRLPGIYAAGQAATASIQIRPEAVYRKDQSRFVRFARMDVNFRIPVATGSLQSGPSGVGVSPLVNTQFSYSDFGLKTSGDFMEGQKTVLGKVSGIADDEAIFAVITLKVLE